MLRQSLSFKQDYALDLPFAYLVSPTIIIFISSVIDYSKSLM